MSGVERKWDGLAATARRARDLKVGEDNECEIAEEAEEALEIPNG